MRMFCNQCQETARNKGCDYGGVCGKSEDLADLQDLLIYTVKGISEIIIKRNLEINKLSDTNHAVIKSLFMTITNANFNNDVIITQIKHLIQMRDTLRGTVFVEELHDAAVFEVENIRDMVYKASYVGFAPNENEDIASLKHLITFGIKGLAAYIYHALNLGKEMEDLYSLIYEGLAATLRSVGYLPKVLSLAIKTGEYGVKAMKLLDEGNTTRFGNPEITKVNIGVRNNLAILISGHDLTDLQHLLEQTQGTGVDVYTHSEMLPAHYYPAFKQYDHFVGNYGNAWWRQEEEFESFNGPILFTTNCIVPPNNEELTSRTFTTGVCGYPGCFHFEENLEGKKDFSPVIDLAKTLPAPVEIERGTIVGGFAHHQLMALADTIVAVVKTGAIKKFFVMAGCDGRMKSREYYTEFAQKLPPDTVILTAGCAKYRYNKLELGDIGGIPRILDAGQCNDSYSLAVIALQLKEVFELEDINQLPIVFNIAWYEQKAVIVLLALLYLGVKKIHLGPTLPGFLSPNVAKVLVDKYGLAGIGTVDEDIQMFMAT